MRRLALATALLILAAGFLPLAEADHAYSHRYILYGRVVDKSGYPVKGLTVNATIPGQDIHGGQATASTGEGGCARNNPPVTSKVTNETGDYFWCFHTHQVTSVTASYDVEVRGERQAGKLDPQHRQTRLDFRLPYDVPDALRGNKTTFEKSYTLTVFLWEPGSVAIEGISVEGTALTARKVDLLVTYNGDKTLRANGTTNAYGQTTFHLAFPEPLSSGSFEATGPKARKAPGALDLLTHASTAVITYPGESWYENPGLLTFAILGGVAVAGVGAWGIWRVIGGGGDVAGRAARRRRG